MISKKAKKIVIWIVIGILLLSVLAPLIAVSQGAN